MIGVKALNPDGLEVDLSLSEWQALEKQGYTFVSTFSKPADDSNDAGGAVTDGKNSTVIQKSSTKKTSTPRKNSGCGCS